MVHLVQMVEMVLLVTVAHLVAPVVGKDAGALQDLQVYLIRLTVTM